ncbi:MAG: sulfur carrier protein ThiS [Panacagrimonas sp.]
MHLIVNGSPLAIAESASVANLIDQMQLTGRRLAVELNGEIVMRSTYADAGLQEGDRVEIVQAIGGG